MPPTLTDACLHLSAIRQDTRAYVPSVADAYSPPLRKLQSSGACGWATALEQPSLAKPGCIVGSISWQPSGLMDKPAAYSDKLGMQPEASAGMSVQELVSTDSHSSLAAVVPAHRHAEQVSKALGLWHLYMICCGSASCLYLCCCYCCWSVTLICRSKVWQKD